MLFDWFTVFAQIVNFLILMWLLKRFLYKPVLDAIDAREKRIADLLQETESNQQQMSQQQAELTTKNEQFATQRDGLLIQAKSEAACVKQELLEAASQDVAQQRSQWLSGLQKEQVKLKHDISQRTQQEVFTVARKTLQDLSDVALETQITQVFIKQLVSLGPQQCQQFSRKAQGDIVIRSAMDLTQDNKTALQQAVNHAFSAQISVLFEEDATLVCGLEMVGNGHKLSWNIDDYLLSLEDSIASIVDSKVVQGDRQAIAKGVPDDRP